ncbi:nucleotide exchange factor GrpE [Halobacteria archaeon AArc-curdl1]|uniref:Protein GrpE n=1 Tax=Natronosalvus hydrolyticus TaxID=2979988 RepID=A0AAP2Z6W8_9EURY|nr:nucleotide exchange factor GrpE [Halobacteria archaeon AArc-curdl1]
MPTSQSDDSVRRIPLELTLEEAFSGLERELSIEQPTRCRTCSGTGRTGRPTRCPQCRGRGRVARDKRASIGRPGSRRCPRCEGSGTVSASQCAICDGDGTRWQETAVSVDVPPGIEDGQGLRVTAGADQQPIAILEVTIEPHERYDRIGTDLSCEHAVTPRQARTGDAIEIETLDGDVQFEVPPGTEAGDRFRFEGKGMPTLDGDERGDLYVTIALEDEPADEPDREGVEGHHTAESANRVSMAPDADVTGPDEAKNRESTTSTEQDGDLAVESDDGDPLANERPADECAPKEADESTLEAYESRIEALESALESTRAEFRAYKDRVETRQKERDKQAAATLLERFAEVREDLERAVETDSDDETGVKEGVELTLRRFDRILEDEGVSRIDPEPGTPVDPHRHEVMHRVEGDQPAGTVNSVYTRGYELDDQVIRPARVSVSEEA